MISIVKCGIYVTLRRRGDVFLNMLVNGALDFYLTQLGAQGYSISVTKAGH